MNFGRGGVKGFPFPVVFLAGLAGNWLRLLVAQLFEIFSVKGKVGWLPAFFFYI
jgi:hypothetical protein